MALRGLEAPRSPAQALEDLWVELRRLAPTDQRRAALIKKIVALEDEIERRQQQ